ncbi:hypothetical protein PHA51_00925 [Rodentibacter pneumotropicus]|uniref:hypothetical protein n=1 Tax=Rodentibacter pneumotropicus TaxID=758 RepID=UPI00232CEBFB|nr:hypothetical protein [Rodentibacter pneumotropicus]MDC2824602.1 hypothetical protein [Rodentibacter pneumotropicus]
MEQNTQPKYGKHIPTYLQADLTKAHQAKAAEPNEAPKNDEMQVDQKSENQFTETTTETSQAQGEPQSKQEQTVPHSTSEQDIAKTDNDVNAWKGRLKKEQAERQNLNARLIEEAEARERAERRVRELESTQHQQTNQAATTTQSDPNGLSDTELQELRMFNPDLYLKVKNAQDASKAQSTATTPTSADTPSTTNTQAQTQTAQPSMTERDRIWYAEVQREIPEVQGLLGDSKFVEFAQGKADWTGANGLDLIQKAGANKDVRLIPVIRNLLDEYKQSQVSTPATVTVAPQKTATVKAKVNTPKVMTEKDEAHAEMLARQGKTKELREFLTQFKK